ncbi:MAG: metal-dependent hydrolase [Actinobacteria bacterium]|nr:metal-dependent hydrolase [Actinomycetota bacterium]
MLNATHETIGVASALAGSAAIGSDPATCAIAAGAALYAARLPDADQLGSRVHRRSRLERRHFAALAVGTILRLPMIVVALAARHRGATHWLLTGAVVTAALTALAAALSPTLAPPIGLGVALGYVTHLLADACTPHGAPLLGPFSQRRHLLPRSAQIRTGSGAELAVLALVGSAAVALTMTILSRA